MNARVAAGLRVAGAVAVLLGGSVHAQQWFRNYRDLAIGPLFLANALLSVVIAIGLFVTDDRRVLVAGLVLSLGSLGVLVASRSVGLPGFDAVGYDRPELEAIAVETLASVLLAAALVATRRSRRPTPDARDAA